MRSNGSYDKLLLHNMTSQIEFRLVCFQLCCFVVWEKPFLFRLESQLHKEMFFLPSLMWKNLTGLTGVLRVVSLWLNSIKIW